MPPKILIIEDEDQIRKNIAILLQNNAYEPIEAASGEEGLRLVWENAPDLIICDIMMPGLEGYEVLKILSQDPNTSAIPFIFLTAKDKRSEIRQGMELGSDDYITKPYNNAELLTAVQTRLQKRRLMKDLIDARFSDMVRQRSFSVPGYLLPPLSVLLGYSDLLANSTEPLEGSQIRQIGREIQNSAQQIARVLENYRIFSDLSLVLANPEQLSIYRQCQCLEAHNLIWELVAVKTLSGDRKEDIKIESESVNLATQESHFQRMIEELLDRAIRLSLPHSQIVIVGQKIGWEYRVQISFYGRPALNRNDLDPAADLGLMVVTQLMELYRGRLTIELTEEQSQLSIYLPVIQLAETRP